MRQLTLGLLVLGGCAHVPVATRQCEGDTLRMDPTERLLVTREAASQPMAVVTNDTAVGNRFLRTPSRPLDPRDPEADHLIQRMRSALRAERGVGIAAPQVGISRRVILVQRFDAVGHRRGPCDETRCPVRAYFNPTILTRSAERESGWEGCLSIPAGRGQVPRSRQIVIQFQDPRGHPHEESVPGFTARILQHEIDHLDGVLFIDRMEGPLVPSSSRPSDQSPAGDRRD